MLHCGQMCFTMLNQQCLSVDGNSLCNMHEHNHFQQNNGQTGRKTKNKDSFGFLSFSLQEMISAAY